MDYQILNENEDLKNHIHDIVFNEDDYIDAVRKNNRFEYHYFLSPLREDLFHWYPFKKEGSILEIGASYGQLTSLFTKRVSHVVSIENNQSRCDIISKRAEDAIVLLRDYNDLQIDEKFDYIILCNTFEYAKSFVESKDPYVDYLNYLKGFLNDDGIILIALSNRLGLKYFSGFKEEHTNQFFKGIEGFGSEDIAQTFSRTELMDIINDSGFSNFKFFYPYPDHEFPQVIHTDKLINKIPFMGYTEVSNDRIHAFDEGTVNLTLSKDNLSQYFANSFLVEIRSSDGAFPTDNIDYVKIHSDKEPECQIYTTIFSDGTVSKSPITPKANEHIRKMFEQSTYVMGKIRCLPAEMKGDSISYVFLDQKTCGDMLIDAVIDDDRNRFFEIVEDFYDALFYNSFECSDYANEEFLKIFREKSDIKFHCHEKSNFDIGFANMFLIDGVFTAIDYEWIADFPIPLEYLFYVSFFYHFYSNKLIRDFTSYEEVFNHFNLDTGNLDLFKRWYCNFLRSNLKRPPVPGPRIIPLENIDEVVDALHHEIESLREEIDLKNNEIQKLVHLNEEIKSLKREINQKDKEINKKNREIKSLLSSNSWRITEPLRRVKSVFNKR